MRLSNLAGAVARRVARFVLLFPFRGPRGAHITRYVMLRELGRFAREIGLPTNAPTASISGSLPMCTALGIEPAVVVDLSYPHYDALNLEVADGSFDVVVCDQVLEHVGGSPQRATDEMLRILRPGGYLFLATCFVNPLHPAPGDYWRFTPDALELLCRGKSTVLTKGGWGNRWVWLVEDAGLRYEPVIESRWSLLRYLATLDNPKWAIHTWVVARKLA